MDWRFSTFLLFLFALLFGIPWATSEAGFCGFKVVQKAISSDDATTCLEFWLNRYQTLISAILALFSAGIAALLLWRQLSANQIQAAAAVGDMDPDFSLEWDFNMVAGAGDLDDAIIRVQNYNRRPISLRKISLIKPTGAILLQEFESNSGQSYNIKGEFIDRATFALNRWIPGRDPVGGVVIDAIRIIIADEDCSDRAGREEDFCFRIEYRLLGNPVQTKQVDVVGFVNRR